MQWSKSAKAVVLGAGVGIAVGLGGFLFAEIPETHAMGPVMFLLVPLAAGFGIATVAQGAQRISAAALLAMLGSLAVLIATKAETPLCAVLAFPLLFVGLMTGVGLAYLSRQAVNFGRGGGAMKSMMFLSVPVLLFAGHLV